MFIELWESALLKGWCLPLSHVIVERSKIYEKMVKMFGVIMSWKCKKYTLFLIV